MNKREQLKEDILNSIKPVEITGEWYTLDLPVTAEKITNALREHHNVIIPEAGDVIRLEAPIYMGSDSHLKAPANQIFTQTEDSDLCLVRNEHLIDGAFEPAKGRCDENISIEGGIWQLRKGTNGYAAPDNVVRGSRAAIIISGAKYVDIRNLTIKESAGYGIQIDYCDDFKIENIFYDNHHKDGVHVNGPVRNGLIKHLTGEKMDDDMVALNAWDWWRSAITFGTIERLVVEDIQSNSNEFRLLPGQKVYDNGEKVDCDIRDCVIENVTGIYTFKLYAQHCYSKQDDVSGTVGVIDNVHFKDISFVKISSSGFGGLPVKSLFEMGADCSNIYIEDVNIENSLEQCDEMDLRLINVGPLSATYKWDPEKPETWTEVFDPDTICTVDDIYLKNIMFAGKKETDVSKLTREVHLTVNPDYPNTTPKGGTGYGIIKKVFAE